MLRSKKNLSYEKNFSKHLDRETVPLKLKPERRKNGGQFAHEYAVGGIKASQGYISRNKSDLQGQSKVTHHSDPWQLVHRFENFFQLKQTQKVTQKQKGRIEAGLYEVLALESSGKKWWSNVNY